MFERAHRSIALELHDFFVRDPERWRFRRWDARWRAVLAVEQRW